MSVTACLVEHYLNRHNSLPTAVTILPPEQ